MNEVISTYLKVFKQFSDFDGRARRKEYWTFILTNTIGIFVVALIFGTLSGIANSTTISSIGSYLVGLLYFVTLLPSIAVGIRRLHDKGRSGWMMLVIFIPMIGTIWFLVMMIDEGTKGPNQYGADPKEADAIL
ncbi:inner membrane protein [Bacteroidales bacterium]|nr:inner membrane protein [Bacteroidales bacterium]